MEPNVVLQLISQRVSEINAWIVARNLVWAILLVFATWLCWQGLRSSEVKTWVLVGCVPIFWLSFEASAGYYIHISGAHSKRLEALLPQTGALHEHQRASEKEAAAGHAAPVGFFIPYLILLATACYMLSTNHKTEDGVPWTIALMTSCLVASSYYAWLIRSAQSG